VRLTPTTPRPNRGAIPMTSMIDVVFLLLVFFLVTSNFSGRETRIDASLLPSDRGGRAPELQPQIIEVDRDSDGAAYTLGSRRYRDPAALTATLRSLPKEPGVVIRATPRADIGAIAGAMQAASDAGFEKRSYAPRSR